MKNQKISTKRIAMAGLLAALTAVGSGLRIVIPVSIGGNSAFHLATFSAPSAASCWVPVWAVWLQVWALPFTI